MSMQESNFYCKIVKGHEIDYGVLKKELMTNISVIYIYSVAKMM